jgi:hypothetical protein
MKARRDMLRQRFYAETDVEIDPVPTDWEQYALWLEHLVISELNNELVQENELLRIKMENAREILEQGIIGRYKEGRK